MTTIALNGTAGHLVQSFSWMLLHSLWQGLLLAAAGAVLLIRTKNASAAVRYNLILAQLTLFLVVCSITFFYEWQASYPGLPGPGLLTLSIPISGIEHYLQTVIRYFTDNAPMVVLLWFLVFLFRSVKVMNGLLYLNLARHRQVYRPAAQWQVRLDQLCSDLGLNQTVQLLESGFLKVPMIIGHLKPVILLPVGMLAGIPSGQVEAILLHELAHIRRNDYLVNLLQTIAETLFFFNPGLLWLSSLLRDERENCCDDLALAQTGNKREFVEALIAFKEYALYAGRQQVAFPGRKSQLLQRISRIVDQQPQSLVPDAKGWLMTGVIALAVAVMLAMAGTTPANSKQQTPPTARVVEQKSTGQTEKRPVSQSVHKPRHRSVNMLNNTQVRQRPAENFKLKLAANQEPVEMNAQQPLQNTEHGLRNPEQEQLDKQQAKLNEMQAAKNEEQARRNAEQAKRNEIQRIRNEEQAERNREQAKLNEIQARKNAGQISRQE